MSGLRDPRGGPAQPGRDWSGGDTEAACNLCGRDFLGVRPHRTARCRECHNRLRRDAYAQNGGVHASRKRGRTPSSKWSNYRAAAKRRGYEFNIPRSEFDALLRKNCHYCGGRHANGIDRYNNDAGYVDGNVVACCGTCNTMKMTAHGDEFVAHCAAIARRWGKS